MNLLDVTLLAHVTAKRFIDFFKNICTPKLCHDCFLPHLSLPLGIIQLFNSMEKELVAASIYKQNTKVQ
jgi:hypothetical protein